MNRLAYTLTALCAATPLMAMDNELAVPSHDLMEYQAQDLSHDSSDFLRFFVKDGETMTPVNHYDLDPLLQNISTKGLNQFLKHGYLEPKKLSNGEYKVHAKVRGPGGGLLSMITAPAMAKAAVHGASQVFIFTAAAATGAVGGPAATVQTYIWLNSVMTPFIEGASCAAVVVAVQASAFSPV